MASYDLAIGEGRFIAGLLTPDQEFVTYGTVDFRFGYLGTRDKPGGEPKFGRAFRASFLAVPGDEQNPMPTGPVAGPASKGRGVYGTLARFDRAGFWKLQVTADIKGDRRRVGEASFEVLEKHEVPAVGDVAPRTENLTVDSTDVPRAAIDSRAVGGGEIPDAELHRTTIAAAISQGRPALVVFATPTYCMSRFCGPVTDMVLGLAKDYPDRAAFIHVEIWREFDKQVLNKAAAEWLLRGEDLREPWLFFVGSDGRVAARWDNVATRQEIEPLLQKLPKS